MVQKKRWVLCGILAMFIITIFAAGLQGADRDTYKKTEHAYVMPDVVLIDQHGKKVRFDSLFRQKKVIVLDFIFGTCTTICPVLSAGFVNFQNRLGHDAARVHLISISIDPEHDTPKILKEYLRKFRAKPGWDFLTGSRENINKVMHAFNAYTADKMAHAPLTFVYSPVKNRWARIDGLTAASELMDEYRKALGR
jgi:protein SCO1